MEIKIDTERDSKEQLALLAEFLQKLAGTRGSYSSSSGNQFEPAQKEGLFNLFNTNKDEESNRIIRQELIEGDFKTFGYCR